MIIPLKVLFFQVYRHFFNKLSIIKFNLKKINMIIVMFISIRYVKDFIN